MTFYRHCINDIIILGNVYKQISKMVGCSSKGLNKHQFQPIKVALNNVIKLSVEGPATLENFKLVAVKHLKSIKSPAFK